MNKPLNQLKKEARFITSDVFELKNAPFKQYYRLVRTKFVMKGDDLEEVAIFDKLTDFEMFDTEMEIENGFED